MIKSPTGGALPGDNRRRGPGQPGHRAERAQDGPQEGLVRRIPIGRRLCELLDQAIGNRAEGHVALERAIEFYRRGLADGTVSFDEED